MAKPIAKFLAATFLVTVLFDLTYFFVEGFFVQYSHSVFRTTQIIHIPADRVCTSLFKHGVIRHTQGIFTKCNLLMDLTIHWAIVMVLFLSLRGLKSQSQKQPPTPESAG